MKLFIVEVQVQMPVWAEDEYEAQDIARANVRDAIDDADYDVNEVRGLDELPAVFANALPWGCKTDTTCLQLIEGEEDTDVPAL